MMPFSSRKTAIGVDIGSSSFRVARLTKGKDKPYLSALGSIRVPRGAIAGGEIIDEDVVAQSLAELWKKTGLKEKEIVFGVANQRVVVRLIDFPYMEPNDLKSAIQFQAQDFIPLPIEDVILDYQVIEEYFTESGDRMLQILLVAAQKGMVELFVRAAEKAGLKPVIVDMNAFATARALVGTVNFTKTHDTEEKQTSIEKREEENVSVISLPIKDREEKLTESGEAPTQQDKAGLNMETAVKPEELQVALGPSQTEDSAGDVNVTIEPPELLELSEESPMMSEETTETIDSFTFIESPEDEDGSNKPSVVNDGGETVELRTELPRKEVTAIIDIGAGIANLIILESQNVKFVRVIGVGGDDWTQSIVELLGVSFEEAEELKQKVGLPPLTGDKYLEVPGAFIDKADAVYSALEREAVKFIGEIRRSFEYYVSQTGGNEVGEVIISGGASNLRNFTSYLESGLGVKVSRGNPLLKVEASNRLLEQVYAGEEYSYTIAIGLALRGLS